MEYRRKRHCKYNERQQPEQRKQHINIHIEVCDTCGNIGHHPFGNKRINLFTFKLSEDALGNRFDIGIRFYPHHNAGDEIFILCNRMFHNPLIFFCKPLCIFNCHKHGVIKAHTCFCEPSRNHKRLIKELNLGLRIPDDVTAHDNLIIGKR